MYSPKRLRFQPDRSLTEKSTGIVLSLAPVQGQPSFAQPLAGPPRGLKHMLFAVQALPATLVRIGQVLQTRHCELDPDKETALIMLPQSLEDMGPRET